MKFAQFQQLRRPVCASHPTRGGWIEILKFPLAIFARMVYSWGVRVAALTPAGFIS